MIYFLPQLVGAVVEQYGLSDKQMGVFASSDLIGYSIGSISSFFWIRQVNWKKAALMSIVIMIVGNFLSPMMTSYMPLLLVRIITGVGQGMAVAITLAIIADSTKTDRNFAVYLIITLIVGAAGVVMLPDLMVGYGASAIYWGQIICSLVALPFAILWLPAHGIEYEEEDLKGGLNRSVLLSLFSVFLLYIGYGGLWALAERIGNISGLSADYIGWCLSISLLWAIVGLLIPIFFELRFGRLFPISISILSLCVFGLLMFWDRSETGFLIAVSIGSFGINMILPYITGVIGENDKSGKGVIMVTPMYSIGFALGPSILSLFIFNDNYSYVGYIASIFFVVCFLIFFWIIKTQNRILN